MNLAILAYNSPHKKTQDFLFRLLTERVRPTIVIAANMKPLPIPKPTLRVKPRHIDIVHPQSICDAFDIEYCVMEHNSSECCHILRARSIDVALISGARILKHKVIESVSKAIINVHPGVLPYVRGYDALQWAIVEGHPLGVTAHTLDERIDGGRIIRTALVPEYPDDTLIDLSLRLEQAQTNIITAAIRDVEQVPLDQFELVPTDSVVHAKMSPDLEAAVPNRLSQRLAHLTQE